jgi:hypothetical protein
VLDTQPVLAEIDEVFARCGTTAAVAITPRHDPHARAARLASGSDEPPYRSTTPMVTGVVAAIERSAPRQSYVDAAHAISRTTHGGLASTPVTVDLLLGVLQSVRADVEAEYVRDLEARARDALSEDLLETAEAIVGSGFHPAPAIVLAVSVLEEHVRKMAEARNIATTKSDGTHRSFDDMTNDLQRVDAIRSPEKRVIGGWYGQRTAAAHGRFNEVIPEEAPRIISGVRDFIVRHSQEDPDWLDLADLADELGMVTRPSVAARADA